MQAELPELTVADCAEWRAWLGEHHGQQTAPRTKATLAKAQAELNRLTLPAS